MGPCTDGSGSSYTWEMHPYAEDSSHDGDRQQRGAAPMLPELLAQMPPDEALASFSAGGAYVTKACHTVIAHRGALAVIPPARSANRGRRPS